MLMASICLWAQINFGIREKTLHLESVGQSLGCLLWNFLSLLSLPRGAWALGSGPPAAEQSPWAEAIPAPSGCHLVSLATLGDKEASFCFWDLSWNVKRVVSGCFSVGTF